MGEECDGQNLNGNSCQSMGFMGGTLTCSENCTYDLSGCTTVCGNSIREVGETCDDGNTDADDGCSSSCEVEAGWECDENSPSACSTFCGDSMAVGDEACDGDDLSGETCAGLGYGGGTLGCMTDCQFDESLCVMDRASPFATS